MCHSCTTQILKAFSVNGGQSVRVTTRVIGGESYDTVARGARVIVSAGILDDCKRDRGKRVGLTGAAADATAMNERSLDPYTWSRILEN